MADRQINPRIVGLLLAMASRPRGELKALSRHVTRMIVAPQQLVALGETAKTA
jgi:hypothetical protein